MKRRVLPGWLEELSEDSDENASEINKPMEDHDTDYKMIRKPLEQLPQEKENVSEYPLIQYNGKIVYLTDTIDIACACDELMSWVNKQTDKSVVPIAFDMEWPYSLEKGSGKSAVIQLCADEEVCYVLQISKLKKLPAAVMALLSHPKVRLLGVNIKNDIQKLGRDFPGISIDILINQCIDLGGLCNEVCDTEGVWSLEALVSYICNLRIDKNYKVRSSDWNKIPLDDTQKLYAAIDVYISQVIYRELKKRELKKPKQSEYPFIQYSGKIVYLTDSIDIACACDDIMSWVNKQTDKSVVPIAFDMEWPVYIKKGPGKTAVMQLCADEEVCYVLQISQLNKLPAAVMALLAHPKVCLHGVNIKNDFRKLERDFPGINVDILIDQCVDLGTWCNEVCNTGERWSLERLVSYICNLRIDKNKKVRMSRWHIIPLDDAQKLYAAIDVYISQVIYRELEKRECIKKIEE